MCTAISYKCKDTYFGRTLDLEHGYGERVVITPRRFAFQMRQAGTLAAHYAMIGMAAVAKGFPLYFEATNEMGLSMAGLNFPQSAVYSEWVEGKANVAPFELIPWILGRCACVAEAKQLFANTNVTNVGFSRELPVSPLHWMICDPEGGLVFECRKDGGRLFDNPFGVLTNDPPFEFHAMNVNNYMGLGTGKAEARFGKALPFSNYSAGMGALGLPGDFSSTSRFVRALFVKENSVQGEDEQACVNQFFHILSAVAMPKGCVCTPSGYEYTRYRCCCNVNKGIYYYSTYEKNIPIAVRLHGAELEQTQLYQYENNE